MKNHHFDFNEGGCVCGSAWDYMDNECVYVLGAPKVEDYESYLIDDSDIDLGYYECGHGHAFCNSHK